MLDLSQDIDSLSNFKRKTSAFVKRMRKSGEPMVLTINGKAQLVVQDVESYQKLIEMAEFYESVQFIRESMKDVDAGRTVPAIEFIESLGKKK